MSIFAILALQLGNVAHAQVAGAPVAITGEYGTEESWIVNEILGDVTEMSAYAVKRSAKAIPVHAEMVRPGVYRVSGKGLDLSQDIWDPARFAPFAREALGKVGARQNAREHSPVFVPLVELTPAQLTRMSAELSRELAANMRSAPLHEAAALTLGAFALRESAGRFNDVRWALNRMTAHLAMARALAGGPGPGPDGELAEAVRLALSNHQVRALAILDRLQSPGVIAQQPSQDRRALQAWTRGLRLRITQDWRQLADPASASMLEKFEYARARRATMRTTRSFADLETLGIDPTTAADWSRILTASGASVEDGRFLAGAGLGLELKEAVETFSATHGPSTLLQDTDLNARATRCLTAGTPQVIPWGAWAEFSQRHLAMVVGSVDYTWRRMYSLEQSGDEAKIRIDTALQHLTMLPVAAIFRTRGTKGVEYDLARINEAVGVGLASPERMPALVWSWVERAAASERARQRMTPRTDWFFVPSPRMPYEAWTRIGALDRSPSKNDLATIAQEAPYDYTVALAELRSHFGNTITLAEIRPAFGARLDYDLRAIDYAIAHAATDADRVAFLERGCELSAAECVALAAEFVRLNRPEDAVARYERAFADPSFEAIRFSSSCEWLIKYYFAHGKIERALALADRAAEVYSGPGLRIAGWLYEHLERLDEAETLYKNLASRYDYPWDLLGFYYRAINDRQQTKYEAAWQAALVKTFPDGLQRAPAAMNAQPERGVIITKDSVAVTKAGFQAGDFIIGLEGFRVDNLSQYRAVNAFFESEEVHLTLWRGSVFQAKMSAPKRALPVELRTYPIFGESE